MKEMRDEKDLEKPLLTTRQVATPTRRSSPVAANNKNNTDDNDSTGSTKSSTASFAGININSSIFRFGLLSLLALQTAATVVVARYTRSSVPREDLYDNLHLVLAIEAFKLIASCCLESFATAGHLRESLHQHVLSRPYDALKAAVPAVTYLLQNILLFLALTYLPAPLYMAAYQGKIVSTAIVSVVMLGRRYSLKQWMCLLALTAGVTVVILDEQNRKSSKNTSSDSDGDGHKESRDLFLGLAAILGCCFSSAFAGVYIEMVMKKDSGAASSGSSGAQKVTPPTPPSLWMRNIQLAFFSLLTGGGRLLWQHMSTPYQSRKGLLHGFGRAVWVLVFLQVLGGLVAAAVMKYADNVLKGLATGVAVLLVSVSSVLWLHTPVSGVFVVGATAVVVSVYLFSNPLPSCFGMKVRQLQRLPVEDERTRDTQDSA